jgi:ribokinase
LAEGSIELPESPGRIGVIGSSMVDLVTRTPRVPERGETLEASAFAIAGGGKGANQAVAAARLGSPVMLVAKLGDDVFAQDTRATLAGFGIDMRHVDNVAGVPSGVASIFVEPGGENRILIVKGANDHLRPADVDRAAEDLAACDLILLQLEIPLDTVYHAIDVAARLGRPVLLNPAPATPALDLARLRGVAFFMPNQSELALLTGLSTATPAEAARAAQRVRDAGLPRVVVTLGAEGALLVDAHGIHPIAPVPVGVRDTTGAGDAFIGAFAHFYLRSGDVRDALRHASRYAALSITRDGTQQAFADAASFAAFCATLG